jgi:hypothetical protein
MDDEQLRRFIADVCNNSEGSWKRRIALNQLLLAIQNLDKLATDKHPGYPDVLNETLLEVSNKICTKFEPRGDSLATSLANWINGKLRLKYKILALYKSGKDSTLSTDNPINSESSKLTFADLIKAKEPCTLEELENEIEEEQSQQQRQRVGLTLKEYIEQDPEGKLRNCHVRNSPDCNCQALALRLLEIFKDPPDSFADIARDLDMSYQTVNTRWKRNCLPLLQEIGNQLGYQQEEQQ